MKRGLYNGTGVDALTMLMGMAMMTRATAELGGAYGGDMTTKKTTALAPDSLIRGGSRTVMDKLDSDVDTGATFADLGQGAKPICLPNASSMPDQSAIGAG